MRFPRQIQHVTVTQQCLCPHLIENRARIHLRRNLKRDTARNVGLDEAGDDIDRWALRRQDQMNARRAGLLRQPCDQLLDLLADDHHEIGELIDETTMYGSGARSGICDWSMKDRSPPSG